MEVEVGYPMGNLARHVKEWKKISKSKFILGCIKGYQIPFIEKPRQDKPPNPFFVSKKEKREMEIAIDTLLKKRAIVECIEYPDQFLSSFFLVPKPDKSNRFVLN